MGDQFGSEFDDSGSGDVGHNHIEDALDSAQGSERRLQAVVHTVDLGVAFGRLHGIRVDIDRYRVRGSELEGAQGEDAAPAADVEDSLSPADALDEFLDDLLRRGMAAVAEPAQAELDQPRKVLDARAPTTLGTR